MPTSNTRPGIAACITDMEVPESMAAVIPNNGRIVLGQSCERLTHYVLIFLRCSAGTAFGFGTFAGGRIEASGRMPVCGVFLGGFVTFALNGAQVQYTRAVHVAYVIQHLYYAVYVMPVERPEIPYIEPLEYILLAGQQ